MTEKDPTPKEWMRAREELRTRVVASRTRSFEPGKTYTCPTCGNKALESVDDIHRRMEQGGLVAVYMNLHGGRCNACGTEYLEAYEQLLLEAEAQALHRSSHKATISRVGGQKVGTYWPKEIAEQMHLEPRDSLEIQILDHDTMVVRRLGHHH